MEPHGDNASNHTHLCRLIEHLHVRDAALFAYERMDTTLESVLADADCLFDESVLLNHIVRGAHALHALGVLHRDVKPANVMLGGGVAKLIDFGLVRDLDDCGAPMTPQMYTLWYRPPEVLLGLDYGRQADVWAVGLVGVELLRRTPALKAATVEDMLCAIATWTNVRRLGQHNFGSANHAPLELLAPGDESGCRRRCAAVAAAFVHVNPARRASFAAHLDAERLGERLVLRRKCKRAPERGGARCVKTCT